MAQYKGSLNGVFYDGKSVAAAFDDFTRRVWQRRCDEVFGPTDPTLESLLPPEPS